MEGERRQSKASRETAEMEGERRQSKASLVPGQENADEGEASPPPPPLRTSSRASVKQETSTVQITEEDAEEEDAGGDGFSSEEKAGTLPDLHNLLRSLEAEDLELEREAEPPSLFSQPEQQHKYQEISKLRVELEEEQLAGYLAEFEEGVRDDVVMLGSISLEEVQEEERRLRDEHITYLEHEGHRQRQREEKILHKEEGAKKRVATLIKNKREELARREELLRQQERLLMERLQRAFLRAESHLINTLENRKGEVKVFYGDLMTVDGLYGGSRGRRWKVDWDKTPQPIQVKLKSLRGVKDKLPAGRYVLLVSLYNRLGGHLLRWSQLKGQQWGGASMPVFHEGNFYNLEMKLEQSVFTVLPSKASLRPGMVLVFELFLLRGSVLPTDRVVAWGAFPICDGQFDVIEGKYMVPFLRGEMDPNIDKHEKMEELIASDLDHWMCNLYFEIIRLPRYLAGMKEYEVELQFTSGLIGLPDRVHTGWEENKDGEEAVPGSTSDMGSVGQGMSQVSLNSAKPSTSSGPAARPKSAVSKKETLKIPATTIGSRSITKDEKKLKLEDSDTEEEEEAEELHAIQGQEGVKSVKGTPGLYYKRYPGRPVDEYYRRLYSMLPRTSVLVPKQKKRKLTYIEELEQHSFHVQPAFSCKGQLAKRGHEKMNYVARQFLAELGLSQWRSREFWGMLLMMIIIFFLRLYLHYIAQWSFLSAIGIPINKFEFLPYTVSLNYQATLLRAREEIGVVALGPFLNILVLSLLVIFAWVCPKLFGIFPDLGSKFVVCFGLMTFLNPLLILIVDCALLRYQHGEPIADAAKLYWHFYRAQGSGLAGIFITIFLYILIAFISASILYMYFLRLHNNGRMLDVFWRLHGKEENFFKPYDLELSNQELSNICRKAEEWRGEEGERRKVAVYDYIWEEEEMEESVWDENGEERIEKREGKKEVTTHVSIHTLHLDGLRELYRHFLRLPNGAIVEVFGDLAVPGMDKDVTRALQQGAKDLESLLGSQASLPRVRGRQTVHTASGFRPDSEKYPSPSTSPTPSSAGSYAQRKKKL